METLLVAAVAILVGLAVALFGTRLFAVLTLLWGFLAGLILGADLVASLGGVGVFSTLAGWLAGAGLGIVLAAVAAVWFAGAVLILGVGLGAAVGSGRLATTGIEGGFLALLIGALAGGVVGVAIILTDLRSLVVAAISGYGGAMWVTTGALLLLGRVALADLHGVGPARDAGRRAGDRGSVRARDAGVRLPGARPAGSPDRHARAGPPPILGLAPAVRQPLRRRRRRATIARIPRWRNRQTRPS